MSKKSIIMLLGCIVALSLALIGCGSNSSSSSSSAAKQAFVGTWDLTEIVQDGQSANKEELDAIKGLGLEIFMNLNEDGTAALVLYEEVQEGTWEASSATAGSLTLADHKIAMTLNNSQLKFEREGGTALTFEKGEKKEVPTASNGTSANGDSSASENSSIADSSSSAN